MCGPHVATCREPGTVFAIVLCILANLSHTIKNE
jgi:hypothetical protein